MRNYFARTGFIVMDEARQLTVIGLNVRLAGTDCLSFKPETPKIKWHLTLSGKLRFSPRILRNKDANHTNSPSCFRRRNKTVHGDRVIFMAMFVTALIANTFAATIRTASIRQVENFLYSFIASSIDARRPHFFSQSQPVCVRINHKHL